VILVTPQNDSCFPFTDNTWAVHIVPQMVAHSVLHLSFYHCQHDTVWWDSSVGAQAFMGALLPRLRAANNGPSPIMPFELEVVEAALISRTQRLERTLMDVEPQVRLTALNMI
jgi:hypothetical protein